MYFMKKIPKIPIRKHTRIFRNTLIPRLMRQYLQRKTLALPAIEYLVIVVVEVPKQLSELKLPLSRRLP